MQEKEITIQELTRERTVLIQELNVVRVQNQENTHHYQEQINILTKRAFLLFSCLYFLTP